MKLTIKSSYGFKDQFKANISNKFIGRGSEASSTNQYRKDYGDKANCGNYMDTDMVLISTEGNRSGRLHPDFTEIQKALDVLATIVTDNRYHRNRSYNVGERQVAEYLAKQGYVETEQEYYSTWNPYL